MENKIERQREHFNSIAHRYEEGREDANHKRIKHLIWSSALGRLGGLKGRPVRMLEAMCGYAEGLDLAENIAGLECDYHGFDYSEVIVSDLKQRMPDADIWQADATTYKPTSGEFDLMFLIGGLHHVPDNAAGVVRNLADGLAPGGMFVSFEPTHGNPVFKAVRDRIYSKNEIFDEATERAFPVEEYLGFFRNAGLEPVHVSYPGLLAYVLYYNTYAFPFFNRGGTGMVDRVFALDRIFMNSFVGRIFSFATVTIWQKPA
jgi:SAM-dependent methyltransferase